MLGNEASGPVAQIVPVPSDGGDSGENDPLKELKSDIAKAKGRTVYPETTSAGWGEGPGAAPQRDWRMNRLGPEPPDALVSLSQEAFSRMVAACGASAALFDTSDGTSKREALRHFTMCTVEPLARMVEWELSRKLETPVRLIFDKYGRDQVSRAQVFAKLASQEGITVRQALTIAGLIEEGDMT